MDNNFLKDPIKINSEKDKVEKNEFMYKARAIKDKIGYANTVLSRGKYVTEPGNKNTFIKPENSKYTREMDAKFVSGLICNLNPLFYIGAIIKNENQQNQEIESIVLKTDLVGLDMDKLNEAATKIFNRVKKELPDYALAEDVIFESYMVINELIKRHLDEFECDDLDFIDIFIKLCSDIMICIEAGLSLGYKHDLHHESYFKYMKEYNISFIKHLQELKTKLQTKEGDSDENNSEQC